MEQITDFFKDLKDRLASPLLSSFVISWIVANWKVVIIILLYKSTDLKADGYKSYISAIDHLFTLKSTLYIPLMAAVLYVLLFPVLKTLILAFNARVKRWNNRWIYKISETTVLPFQKVYAEKSKYQQLSNKLSEVMTSEEKLLSEMTQLHHDKDKNANEIARLTSQVKKMTDDSNEVEKLRNLLLEHTKLISVNFFLGMWKLIRSTNTGRNEELSVSILNSKISIRQKERLISDYVLVSITTNGTDVVIVMRSGSSSNFYSWFLTYKNDNENLSGKDSDGLEMTLSKL